MVDFCIIVACDRQGGIGFQNKLPWKLPGDMKHFKMVTTSTTNSEKVNAVIMGRKTWESLAKKPLPDRINIVITRKHHDIDTKECVYAKSLESAMEICTSANKYIETGFIIGGAQIYELAVKCVNRILITRITPKFTDPEIDTFCLAFVAVNLLDSAFCPIKASDLQVENGVEYFFIEYNNK